MLFYSGFGLDRFIQDTVLFRVWFREGLYRMLFYSGFGLEKVYTGMLFYSGFGLDRFIQDAVLFRFWFKSSYVCDISVIDKFSDSDVNYVKDQYYILRFYFPYLSLLAQPVNILIY